MFIDFAVIYDDLQLYGNFNLVCERVSKYASACVYNTDMWTVFIHVVMPFNLVVANIAWECDTVQ